MFRLIYRKYGQGIRWKDDLLSGLTVALALVPEAVAFAFVAGVDPLVGLYAAFFVSELQQLLKHFEKLYRYHFLQQLINFQLKILQKV